MGRLIDADALKEKLDELEPYIDCDENSTTWILSDEVYNAVDNAPTVELTEAEVQETLSKRCMTAVANEYLISLHGNGPKSEWVDNHNGTFTCITCGTKHSKSNFCPNCGAYMKDGIKYRPKDECKTCKHYRPYLEQFSNEPRGDGYCSIARMTPEGMTNINCNDDFYCSDYQKGGVT